MIGYFAFEHVIGIPEKFVMICVEFQDEFGIVQGIFDKIFLCQNRGFLFPLIFFASESIEPKLLNIFKLQTIMESFCTVY